MSSTLRAFPYPKIVISGVCASAAVAWYQNILRIQHDKDGIKAKPLGASMAPAAAILHRYNHHFQRASDEEAQ